MTGEHTPSPLNLTPEQLYSQPDAIPAEYQRGLVINVVVIPGLTGDRPYLVIINDPDTYRNLMLDNPNRIAKLTETAASPIGIFPDLLALLGLVLLDPNDLPEGTYKQQWLAEAALTRQIP